MAVYRTTITVTVLSPYQIERVIDLSDIAREMNDGLWHGDWMITRSERLTYDESKDALVDYGTEPEFFDYELLEDQDDNRK